MDDLTILKGIGPAAAKKLIAAGIDSFAKLAAASPDQLVAIDRLPGSPADWAGWLAEAKARLPAPPALRELTNEEMLDLVKAWDDARANLNGAGDAVAAIQAQLADPAIAGPERAQLDLDLAAAQGRVADLAAAIEALRPLPEGVRLPDASLKKDTTPQSEDGQEGGAGNGAGPTAELQPLDAVFLEELDRLGAQYQVAPGEVLAAARRSLIDAEVRKTASAESRKPIDAQQLASVIDEEIDGVLASVRHQAETDPQAALAHLDQQSHEAEQMAAAATSIVTALAAERVRLSRSVECWPLEVVRYDGREQPIGVSLMVEPTVFDQLFAAGAVADEPPEAASGAEKA
jgi:hypothetical protein